MLLFVLGIFLSGYLMMDGNFAGMGMMEPWMFAAMLWPNVPVAVIGATIAVVLYNLLLPKINPTNINEIAPVNFRDALLRLLKRRHRVPT